MNQEKVFCAPNTLGIIDMAIEREDAVLVGQISKETIEQLAVRYPGVFVDTMDNAIDRQDNAMKSPPKEISEGQFIEALECLPPMGWVRMGSTESFKMGEFTCGRITGIYARLGERYFHLSDVFTLKHEEIITKVQASLQLVH